MLWLENDTISINKGDTGNISVTMDDAYGVPVKIKSGSTVKFTVRETADIDDTALISVTVNVTTDSDEVTIVIPATATSALDVGSYSCDIQVTDSDGVHTIFPTDKSMMAKANNWKNFIVLAEVSE